MIQQVKNIVEDFAPVDIMCVFEIAFINSIRRELPNSSITGCFFHLSQSICRKIQGLGSEVLLRYQEDVEFSLRCRMLPALVFVPATLVREVFEG